VTRAAPFALLALFAAAPAAAKGLDPCARFEEPLAYNACLAAHGPRAPETRAAAPGEVETAPAIRERRRAGGRRRLEINLGGD